MSESNGTENTDGEIPCQTEAPEEIPCLTDAPEEIPCITDAAEEITCLTDAAEEITCLTDAPEEIPCQTDAPEEIPCQTDAPEEISCLTDAPEEIPCLTNAPKELTHGHYNLTTTKNESVPQLDTETISKSKDTDLERKDDDQEEERHDDSQTAADTQEVKTEDVTYTGDRENKDKFQVRDWDEFANIPTIHFTFLIKILLPRHSFTRAQEKDLTLDEYINQTNRRGKAQNTKCIIIGSTAERYMITCSTKKEQICDPSTILYSDVDVLLERWMYFSSTNSNGGYVVETGTTHPGYARILIVNPEKTLEDERPSIALVVDDKFYLNAKMIREDLHDTIKEEAGGQFISEVKGPTVAMENPIPVINKVLTSTTKHPLTIELVNGIACNWLSVANEWKTRERLNNWLEASIIDFVVNQGCHLVPVSHKKSDHPDVEWRISFATSEVHLAKTIVTEDQRQCYLCFKLLRKATMGECDLISSYHCKTVFLYSCERLPLDAWENTGACLLYMLDLLRSFVEKRFLPSYFIPENNLIDHFSEEDFGLVEEILLKLRKDPITPILKFTDTHNMARQSRFTHVPFREIIGPVLNDFNAYGQHRKMGLSLDSFIKSLYTNVDAYLEVNKIPETVDFLINSFKLVGPYFEQAQIDNYMYGAFGACRLIMQLVQAFEKIISYSQEFPGVLLLRGHLANLYHCGALNFRIDTDKHKHMLEKAESLFTSVMSDEGRLTPATIDYACLLIAMGKLRQAYSCLVEFISNHQHVQSMQNDYSRITYLVLHVGLELRDAVLDVFKRQGWFSVPSLSLAHYLRIQCLKELTPEENSNIDLAINEFELHSESIKPANMWSHCLSAFALMKLERYLDAESAFKKVLTTARIHVIIHVCHSQYLVKNGKAKEAVQYLIETGIRYNRNVAYFIDIIASKTTSPQYAVTLYEEITALVNEYPDALKLRGNMACMYHSCAYQYKEDSEEFLTCLVQAETLFHTLMVGDESSLRLASKIDYCALLMSQKRWRDVQKILSDVLHRESKSQDRNGYDRLEFHTVDKNLQNEIQIHGNFEAKSIAFAFYFLVKSMLSIDAPLAELQKIVAKFKAFCEHEEDARVFSLLGYTYMMLKQFSEAALWFSKAVMIRRDYAVAKQNIAQCQKELHDRGLSKYQFDEFINLPCLWPDLEGDYTYGLMEMIMDRNEFSGGKGIDFTV